MAKLITTYQYRFPFPLSNLTATISMHSFIVDHDRTIPKSENHLFYFNLHANPVIKRERNCKGKFWEKKQRALERETVKTEYYSTVPHTHTDLLRHQ